MDQECEPEMQMEDLSFADLNQELIQKVKQLENELRSHTDQDIVLLAYHQPNQTRTPEN